MSENFLRRRCERCRFDLTTARVEDCSRHHWKEQCPYRRLDMTQPDTLFPLPPQPAPAAEPKPEQPPDYWNLYAREVKGAPEGWRWCKLNSEPRTAKVPEGYARIDGAVMPLKPGSTWVGDWSKRDPATESSYVVNVADFRAWCERYAARFGKCDNCWGSGKEVDTVSIHRPTTYRTCHKCKGTGQPKAAAAAS